MLARRALASICVLLVFITSCGGGSPTQASAPPPPPPSSVPASFFSMTIHGNNNLPTIPFGSARLWGTGTSWMDINYAPGVFDFTNIDTWIGISHARHIDLIYTFGQVPGWASSNPGLVCGNNGSPLGSCAPPNDLNSDGTGTNQHWKDFVTAVVTHAAGQIKYWEIWNEPTVSGYWQGTNQQMLRLAQDAYTIIKSADPNALVATPSPSTGITGVAGWMGPYLGLGGGKYADIIAFHAYSYVNQPGVYPQPEDIVPLINNLKSVLAANAQAQKPLWCTEGDWGMTNVNGFTDQDLHAAYLARHYLLQESEGVARYYWYAWDNGFSGGLPDGLWVPNSGITLPGTAYQQVENWLVGATSTSQCSTQGTVWTCNYTRSNGYQAEAIWDTSQACSNGVCSTSSQPASSQYLHYRDLAGNTTQINGGTVPVGAKPILLENQ
ncbi:MAG TPA: cellulase family glycosylhydrolase [Terriglobales bacterium]|nr:cellulase family glycosylhydrolase [Terriglobales bacterium]